MTSHPNNEHGVNCGANEKINMDDWKEPAMDKIFELFNKHSKEIEFSGGYSGSVLLYDGFIKAITEVLAERDARIKELEDNKGFLLHELNDVIYREARALGELHRIKEGAKKLEAVSHYDGSGRIHPAVLISDLDRLMKGGE